MSWDCSTHRDTLVRQQDTAGLIFGPCEVVYLCEMSAKDLFKQENNIMCEAISADDFIALCHGKAHIWKVNRRGVKHLDILMVQLLHT